MGYCSIDDLRMHVPIDWLVQTSQDDPGQVREGVPGDDRLNAVIADASSIIDTYLNKRYVTPLPEVPAIIKTIAVDIVKYRLFRVRMSGDVPEDTKSGYNESIRLLELLQSGDLSLPAESERLDAGSIIISNRSHCDRKYDKHGLRRIL